ncbi:hypothetical protein VTK26DRAFT_3198 [Humicola hyalothermophila]
MSSLAEQYTGLRLNNEIKPLLHRYGIPYDKKANKESLLALLRANGVPLDRVQRNETAPDLDKVEVRGLEQIARDYPPLSSDESSSDGMDEDSGGGSGNGSGDGMDEDSGSGNGSGDGMDEDSGSGDGSGDRMDEDSSGRSGDGSGDGMDEDSSGGSGDGSGDGPSPGLVSDSTSTTTRSAQRLLDLPDHKRHAEKARQAGIPDPANKLTDLERRLLLEYPAASACLPTIKRGLGQAKLKQKVSDLVDWFASVAKSQNIPVGPALVFFDSYLSSPKLDFVAYLLDKDGCREGWYGHASNPNARKQAAKRLDHLWSLALDSPEAMATTTASSDPTAAQDFFMDVIDPYDGAPSRGKVIGIHMTKKNVLAVRLDSLSAQYPDLGRGLWVECKSEKELEAYKKYVKAGSKKLNSEEATLLDGCKAADFHLDCVFRMKWGKAYHCHGYGYAKTGDTRRPLMFSKTALSKAFKGAAMEMLQKHLERTGQSSYEGTDDAQPEVIKLRAKRPVPVQ